MSADNILKTIQETFEEVFGVDAEEVTLNSTKDTIEEWDSLRHLEIITAIEGAFSIKFEMQEIIHLNTIEAIVNTVSEKGVAAA